MKFYKNCYVDRNGKLNQQKVRIQVHVRIAQDTMESKGQILAHAYV